MEHERGRTFCADQQGFRGRVGRRGERGTGQERASELRARGLRHV